MIARRFPRADLVLQVLAGALDAPGVVMFPVEPSKPLDVAQGFLEDVSQLDAKAMGDEAWISSVKPILGEWLFYALVADLTDPLPDEWPR